ncbi:hypothetical protein QOZ80_9AG0682370 [Eleusine coracana subsp. coracana]|nr:hypothetical protein QOZ80_9AG0682370 [Eleusine coracana subsp. coracana]
MPPGYKFIPSDEDIVVRYLRCRALNQPLPSAFITDKDILNHNPWDLLPEGASEKYFFHHRVLRWATGTRWKRATKDGFWKASGKEVPIYCSGGRSRIQLLVGLKRTQVFYIGKAPAGQRTNWVMDEYRLAGAGLSPYRVLTPSTNNDIGQRSCITDEAGKKHDDPADALRGTAPSIENTPILLNPDESWVVCRIHKTRKRTPPVVIGSSSCPGEENIPFYDFLGLGNHDQGSANTSTQAESLMEVENSEVEGNGGTSEMASTSNGN